MKTYFIHMRYYPARQFSPTNRGGATIGYRIYDRSDGFHILEYAIAHCNIKDNFNRKIGRQIVTGRLDCDEHYQIIYEGDVVPIEAMRRRAKANAIIVAYDAAEVYELC